MRHRAVLVPLALALCALAWFVLTRSSGEARLDEPRRAARGEPTPLPAGSPTLEGTPRGVGSDSSPGRPADGAPSPSTPAPPATVRTREEVGAELVALLEREIDPEVWTPQGQGALVLRSSVLIARAPADTLHALRRRLDALRAVRAAQVGVPVEASEEPPPIVLGDRERAEAEERLKVLLRGLWRRTVALAEAARHAASGSPGEAHELVAGVLRDEPDNAWAQALARDLEKPSREPTEGQASRAAWSSEHERLKRLLLQESFARWILEWPSAATFAALTIARREAGLGSTWLHAGVERDARSSAPAPRVTDTFGGLAGWARLLTLEALCDVRVDSRVLAALDARPLDPPEALGHTLESLLAALVHRLGAPHLLVRRQEVLLVTRGDLPPSTQTIMFDVADLLPDPVAPPESAPRGPAPGARTTR